MSEGLASATRVSSPIPARAGVGLKAEHVQAIFETQADIGWFEVHPENYMGAGGAPHRMLERIRESYPLSLHGVGLSIGAAAPLDAEHLRRLKSLADRYEPGLISEHLAWSTHDGLFLNDLLPLPYTNETLDVVALHVDQMQSVLKRRVLIENPSTYLAFDGDAMTEVEFLRALAKRTGCGLLLDCNNAFVSATNGQSDPFAYIRDFPIEFVGEFHLAGHASFVDDEGTPLLIDAHDRPVIDRVWELFENAIARAGVTPTLIEWDNDIPGWDTLYAEAMCAEGILRHWSETHACAA